MSSFDSAARAGRHDADHVGQPPRRTVTIRGQVAPARRRPPRALHERAGARPDRVAAWAFMLGIALILAAAVSAYAG